MNGILSSLHFDAMNNLKLKINAEGVLEHPEPYHVNAPDYGIRGTVGINQRNCGN